MRKLKHLLCIALLALFAALLFPDTASAAEKIDSKDGNWQILADYYNSKARQIGIEISQSNRKTTCP